jgi:membrane-associated phospholipid phosphatase
MESELAEIRSRQSARTPETNGAAAFWNTGPATYRWTEIQLNLIKKNATTPPRASRGLGLVHVAMHDAMVAAWDAKYAYRRLRPRQVDGSITEIVEVPPEGSYPSEHAVMAGAAARVLAYLYPSEAGELARLEREAAESRLWAGVNFRSDVERGLELGRAVADQIIARARGDGSDAVWDGSGRLNPVTQPPVTYADTLESTLRLRDGTDNGVNGPHTGNPTYNTSNYHFHVRLNIYINGSLVPIPSWGGGANYIHTHQGDHVVHLHAGGEMYPPTPNPHYITLGEIFDAWRAASTNRNPNAILRSTNLMNNLTDADHVVHVWVNGVRTEAYENYLVREGDSVVAAYRTRVGGGGPPVAACHWEPTPPARIDSPLEPLWGRVKTWLVNSGEQLTAPAPPACGSDEYIRQVREVMEVVNGLTDEQRRIAQFWADGAGTVTPPGHWNQIAQELLLRDNVNTPRAARIMAYLNTAQADAFVACWNNKFTYWSARPITEVRRLFNGSWTPPLETPPFPGYISGHATTSGAASEVLAYFFKSDAENLRAQAREAAISRLYGGIHIRADNEVGLELGHDVAKAAVERAENDGADEDRDDTLSVAFGEAFAYPNPAVGGRSPVIRVNAPGAEKVLLRIFDSAGDPVQQIEHFDPAMTFWEYKWDVSGVASGVYTYVFSIYQQGNVSGKQSGRVAVVK